MRTHQKYNLSRHVAVSFILSRRCRGGDQEQDEPRNADLVEHLEVQYADPRVELGAHEEVVDWITGKPVSPATNNRLDIDNDAIEEPREYCHSHDRPELIDECV